MTSMPQPILVLLMLATLILAGCHSEDDGILPSLKDRYNAIIAFAPDEERAQKMTNSFKSAPDLKEHDIAWFVVGPDEVTSNLEDTPDRELLEKQHSADGFQAVVIGMDGHLVATQMGGLNIEGLFKSLFPDFSEDQLINDEP